MNLSTLRSRPRLALRLIAVFLAAFGLSALCTFYIDPEVVLYKKLLKTRTAWSQKLKREYKQKVVVCGGSSSAFSINPKQLLDDFQLPVDNRGLHAGMGVPVLMSWGLADLQAGDTLIVALEPGLLSSPFEITLLGIQFSYLQMSPSLLNQPWDGTTWSLSSLAGLRFDRAKGIRFLEKVVKDGKNVFEKLRRGESIYRYKSEELTDSGVITTSVRLPFEDKTDYAAERHRRLSEDARSMLQWLSEWAKTHRIRVAYSMPWEYVPEKYAATYQAQNKALLIEIAELIPVLRDPRLGVCSEREFFADTPLHLTTDGMEIRSEEFGRHVKNWEVWSLTDLRADTTFAFSIYGH